MNRRFFIYCSLATSGFPIILSPKSSPVQCAVRSAHPESDFTATNRHARTDPKPSQILVCEEVTIIIKGKVFGWLVDSLVAWVSAWLVVKKTRVSWCFEPSQPLGIITSGVKRSFKIHLLVNLHKGNLSSSLIFLGHS